MSDLENNIRLWTDHMFEEARQLGIDLKTLSISLCVSESEYDRATREVEFNRNISSNTDTKGASRLIYRQGTVLVLLRRYKEPTVTVPLTEYVRLTERGE